MSLWTACTSRPGPEAPSAVSAAPTELPRLRGETMLPLHPSARFSSGWGSVEVISADSPHEAAPEPPFATDQEAERFLRGWLLDTFGPLPDDTALRTTSVDHSASGGERPQHDWDRGHTFVFVQTWRDMPTDRVTVLYLRGRSMVNGTVGLARFTPKAQSIRPILTEDAARTQLALVLRELGQDTAMAADCPMHLEFVWEEGDETSSVLRPVWMMGDGPGLLDAVTGAPGRNG